jgi:hypothetical protein
VSSIASTGISATGGLVGVSEFGTISNCYSTVTVNSTVQAGGVVGTNMGILTNCYATGEVSGHVGSGVAGATIPIGVQGVANCAALNPSISGSTAIMSARVSFSDPGEGDLTNNIGFDCMLNQLGGFTWLNKGLDNIDGEDISAQQINADGTLGGRFTSAGEWTTQNGKLPGLFGKTVDMPPHLQYVGIETIMNDESGITVYPNPTSGELTIMNNEQLTMKSVEVYDVYGRKHLTVLQSYGLTVLNLDIAAFASGVYFLKIQTEQGVVMKKVVKQ